MATENIFSAEVKTEDAGQRLDKWLVAAFPDLSRTRVASLMAEGVLFKNGEAFSDASYKVKADEAYALRVPEAVESEPVPQDIKLDILYEDEDIVVVNKPAGMVVHPGAGNYEGTLVNALLFHCQDSLSGIGGVKRPGIVHRIDKETSGILVVAKNDAAHHGLAEQFEVHSIERMYQAIVWGVLNPLSGTINGNIARSKLNRQKMALVKTGGKEAITHYKVVESLQNRALALVECNLETGRTHQIRVHLTSLGHPLVGDKVYGGKQRYMKNVIAPEARMLAEDFPRQALHAAVLGFEHPKSGELLRFEAPMPEDMQKLLAALR
ncbi:MAG: RluA family pseudouridine synthase [Alphaproteobacteria bacterium]|nr:RluA family pseudouridine synthase [Alphaproteobacteria bacterium]